MQQRPSIAGVVILFAFGLPFAGFGITFAVISWQAFANGTSSSWGGVLFGALFSCIGWGLMAAALIGYKKGNQLASLEEAHLETPWLWKPDWAAGRANGTNAKANIGIWIFTGIWDAITFTVAGGVMPQLLEQKDPKALFLLLFPLAGIVMTVFAARGTLRTMRFGSTAFWFDSPTFSPGSRVKGAIHLKLPTETPHGVDLTLSCKRRIVTGSGKSRSVQEMVLWQEEKNVPAQAVLRGSAEAQVPVEFALPPDAYVTDEDSPNDRVYWQLQAKADVPGVDFSDNYELPVFRTRGSTAAVPANPESSQGVPDQPEEQDVTVPPNTKVVCTEEASGPQFYLPPLRNWTQALTVLAVTVVWSGVVYMLWHDAHAPWIFRLVFSLFELPLVYFVTKAFFGSALLRVRDGALETKDAILGIGVLHRMPYDQVASISPMSQGRPVGGRLMYGIVVRLKDGQEVKVAADALTEQEAKWVVTRLEQTLGLQRDTRTQFRSFYGAPPQPGAVSRGSVGWGAGNRSAQQKPLVIALAVMFGFAAFSLRFILAPSGTAAKGRSRNAAALRVNNSPTQRQAEQLLERSVQHDEGALQQFEQNVGGWTGQLKFTSEMKRLEERSRFSKDLRVREANADLNLAIEGWQRNEQAVDELRQRAETDKGYRARAYYFLGMEGGRGVATEKVFAYLRDRALHDQDAVARQWAVEGLRFFKTDEALDVLYQSFTTDPNPAVRDRAGCNLSDCGIFTRAQRIRFVPKLIELSGDPSISAQMRNWVFMALNEITDAHVMANAEAWRNWYQEHGSNKEEEFARLQWYQVRGDE